MKKVLLQRIKNFAHYYVKLALELPKTYLRNHMQGQLIGYSTSGFNEANERIAINNRQSSIKKHQ